MRGSKWVLNLALALLLATADIVGAGWEIEQTNYNLRASGKEIGRSSAVMRVSKGRARVSDGQTATIFDYTKNEVTLLLPEKKMYWSGSVDQYLSDVRGANPRRRVIPGQMKDSPKPRMVVQETPITATIAGKTTKKYIITADGQPFQDIWMTEAFLSPDLDPERYQALQRKLAQSVRSSYGLNLIALGDDPLYKKISIEEFPVRVNTYLGKAITGTEVVRITPTDVPESDFTVPADFSRVPLLTLIEASQALTDQKVNAERAKNPLRKPKPSPGKPTPGKRSDQKKK